MNRWMLVLVLVTGCGSGPLMAEIYRWVDDQGRVHFGDRPRGASAETVDLPPDPASRPAPDPSGPDAPDTSEGDRLQRWLKAKQEERADRRRAEQKKRNQKNRRLKSCKQARSAWDYYQSGGVFYDDRPDGTRHFLSDAEMAQERDRVRRDVQRLCGTDPTAGARPKDER